MTRLGVAFVEDPLVGRARELLRFFDRRARIFGADVDLFCDPAWCLLLDLFAHGSTEARVPVSSCGIATRVPMTTALRYINILTRRGLVERHANPGDRRSSLLSLTPRSDAMVRSVLE